MKLYRILNINKLFFAKQITKVTVRNYGRTLAKEKVIPIDESTLMGRIVLFLDNDYKRSPSILEGNSPRVDMVKILNSVKSNQANNIKSLNFHEIEDLLHMLKNLEDKWEFQKMFNVIDLECCSRIETLDSSATLRLLNAYVHIVPNKITEYKFYMAALNHLITYVKFLTKEELLQTVFYIGLQKKTKKAQAMIKTCVKLFTNEDIKSFSVEQLCILCNSTFKTSIKIPNKVFLDAVYKTLSNELYLLKDPALFITLIKTIRHNRYQDDDLLSTISCTIFFNKTFKYYSFTAFCHILALYADYAYYDEALLKLFMEKGAAHLENSVIQEKQSHDMNLIRFKDITRFLWVLSTLGYKDIDEKIFGDFIVPRILERIEKGLHSSDVEELIHCILYMWILNYQAVKLLPYALKQETVLYIRDLKTRTKERLNLLLTCIYFENRKLFKEFNVKPQPVQYCDMEYQLRHRTALMKVYLSLKALAPFLEINKFDVSYQIPHLNICGITGYKKNIYKAVYIEVLDDYVCVKNKVGTLIGPMQLKLRILNSLDEAVITMYSDEVEAMTDKELKEHLKYELDFLC